MEANRAAALARRNEKLQHRSLDPQAGVNGSLDYRPCLEQGNRSTALKSCMNIDNYPRSIPSASVNGLSTCHVAEYSGGPKLVDGRDNQRLLQGGGTVGQVTGKRVKVALEICAPDRFFLMVKSGFTDVGFLESISSVSFFYFPGSCCSELVSIIGAMRIIILPLQYY